MQNSLFSVSKLLQTRLSPVSILGVHAGSPIEAGVGGVGGAHVVGHFPGSAATHSCGRHPHRDQGQGARVHQGGRVADA